METIYVVDVDGHRFTFTGETAERDASDCWARAVTAGFDAKVHRATRRERREPVASR